MKANIGSLDRIIRAILGLAMIAAGFYYQSFWGAIGLIPLGTAFMSWCPLYLPFGLSTIRKKLS